MLHEEKAEGGDRKSAFRWQGGEEVFLKDTGEGSLIGRRRTRRCLVREAKEGQNFKKGVASLGKCLREARSSNQ